MERVVSPDFTQRVSDAPERSLPRSLWGQPASTYKIESIEVRHHAARKLAEDLAVVSLLLTQQATFEGRDRSGDFYVVDIWKKSGGRWQMIARYSSPMGRRFDRMRPQRSAGCRLESGATLSRVPPDAETSRLDWLGRYG